MLRISKGERLENGWLVFKYLMFNAYLPYLQFRFHVVAWNWLMVKSSYFLFEQDICCESQLVMCVRIMFLWRFHHLQVSKQLHVGFSTLLSSATQFVFVTWVYKPSCYVISKNITRYSFIFELLSRKYLSKNLSRRLSLSCGAWFDCCDDPNWFHSRLLFTQHQKLGICLKSKLWTSVQNSMLV